MKRGLGAPATETYLSLYREKSRRRPELGDGFLNIPSVLSKAGRDCREERREGGQGLRGGPFFFFFSSFLAFFGLEGPRSTLPLIIKRGRGPSGKDKERCQ